MQTFSTFHGWKRCLPLPLGAQMACYMKSVLHGVVSFKATLWSFFSFFTQVQSWRKCLLQHPTNKGLRLWVLPIQPYLIKNEFYVHYFMCSLCIQFKRCRKSRWSVKGERAARRQNPDWWLQYKSSQCPTGKVRVNKKKKKKSLWQPRLATPTVKYCFRNTENN